MTDATAIDNLLTEGPLTDEQHDAIIPRPVGWHLLVALPDVGDTYKDSVIEKARMTKEHELILSMVGVVIDMGTEAYQDTKRFPNGPWCKVGDYVMFRPNSGTRFKVRGTEYRILNDDSIEAVVGDPSAVQRV